LNLKGEFIRIPRVMSDIENDLGRLGKIGGTAQTVGRGGFETRPYNKLCYDFAMCGDFQTVSSSLSLHDRLDPRPTVGPAVREAP
jgi:hypothetical protein